MLFKICDLTTELGRSFHSSGKSNYVPFVAAIDLLRVHEKRKRQLSIHYSLLILDG